MKTLQILVEFFKCFIKTLDLLFKGMLMNFKTRYLLHFFYDLIPALTNLRECFAT